MLLSNFAMEEINPPIVDPKTKLVPIKKGRGKLTVSENIKFIFVFVDPF